MLNLLQILLNTIEPFSLVLAFLPLVGFLLVLGLIRFSGRVLVTTGGRDTAALAIAIAGLIAVGPAELFFPASAAIAFGPMVWIALAAFYCLVITLIALTTPPKLVIYGRTPEESFEAFYLAAMKIDPSTEADRERLQVSMPTLDVRLRLDGVRGLDHCRVLSFEPIASLKFWAALLGNLRTEFRDSPRPTPRRGLPMLIVAIAIAGLLVWQSFTQQDLLVQGFRNWLWR